MKQNNEEDTFKIFVVLDEINTSARLIKIGFGELQNISATNEFYFMPLQLLSQGFERLMKTYICLGHLNKHGKYPQLDVLKNPGHDLQKLLKVILDDYFVCEENSLLIEEKEFLKNNEDLRELLFILSEFGKLARYHNYDVITGNTKPSINPKDYWMKFETRILYRDPKAEEKLVDWEAYSELYGGVSRYILTLFEKFVCALSRQFIWGKIGEEAISLSSSLYDFIITHEEDLGNRNYRVNTTKYRNAERKVHKRTILDSYRRKFNPKFKSKKIFKSDFEGEWPFYAEEVVVECRDEHWCVVSINGYDYALNGSAKSRYKLESVHDGGVAIVGLGVSDVIKLAFSL